MTSDVLPRDPSSQNAKSQDDGDLTIAFKTYRECARVLLESDAVKIVDRSQSTSETG